MTTNCHENRSPARDASSSWIAPSPPSDGGEGRGEVPSVANLKSKIQLRPSCPVTSAPNASTTALAKRLQGAMRAKKSGAFSPRNTDTQIDTLKTHKKTHSKKPVLIERNTNKHIKTHTC